MHWSTTTQFFIFTSQAIQTKMPLIICKGFNKHSLARFSQIPKKKWSEICLLIFLQLIMNSVQVLVAVNT